MHQNYNYSVPEMSAIDDIFRFERNSETPIYLQLANALIRNIRNGRLRAGLKLPPTRDLSQQLNVHRRTAQMAYDELMAQGWIDVVPRKGAFVARSMPDVKPRNLPSLSTSRSFANQSAFSVPESPVLFPMTSFPSEADVAIDDGFPDPRLAPMDLLAREYRRVSKLSGFKKYLRYGNPYGADDLLDALSIFLNDTRGLSVSNRHLMITRGTQMGIFIAARLLVRPGDHVVVGEPGYFAAHLTLRQAGAFLNRVPVDEYGIEVNAIESLCKKKKIRLVYAIPHHHHPTTVTLIPERRVRLLELAARYSFAIIEDDYDYDFHYHSGPVLPMASLDLHGNVIYVGTFSKLLAPAVRIGFMAAPENVIRATANLRREIDWQGDTMMEAALAELFRNGTIGRHIRKVVKLYHERRDHFCRLLTETCGKHISFKVPDGGMSVWAHFKGVPVARVAAKAMRHGLAISDGKLYNTTAVNYNAIRMGFASLNLDEQEKAVEILKKCL